MLTRATGNIPEYHTRPHTDSERETHFDTHTHHQREVAYRSADSTFDFSSLRTVTLTQAEAEERRERRLRDRALDDGS